MMNQEQVRRLLDHAGGSIEPGPLPHLKARPGRVSTRVTAALGTAAALVLVAVAAQVALAPETPPTLAPPESEPTVPDVVGLEEGDATERLATAGLTGVSDADWPPPAAACSSTVMYTEPSAGARATAGSTVILRMVHEPCVVAPHKLTGKLGRLADALRDSRLDDVPLASVVVLTQPGGGPARRLEGSDRLNPDQWVVWTQNSVLPVPAYYDQAVVRGTPLNCTGAVDALAEGETTRPDITFVNPLSEGPKGDQESCQSWSAIDIWLDDEGAIRHVHLRTWE